MLDLSYPIGKFAMPATCSAAQRAQWIDTIAATPGQLRRAVQGLTDRQLDTPYRPGGWTVRQVTHHVPDSHINAYVRTKLALTEAVPMIKPYDEERWALLADTKVVPAATTLTLLECVHERWVAVLRAASAADFAREYVHPVSGKHTLAAMVGMYAWHGAHHVAHVTRLREREGW